MMLPKIENRIITLQSRQVIPNSDIAELYGVETKRIKEAVKNNPDKFPKEYITIIPRDETKVLRAKFPI